MPPKGDYNYNNSHTRFAGDKTQRRQPNQGQAPLKRIRIDRTQQCPFTVRVRWGNKLGVHATSQPQALEVLAGLCKPDMGLSAWADTQIGDFLSRLVANTISSDALRERSGMVGFEGKPFTIAVYLAVTNTDGSISIRLAHRAKVDEKGSLVRNPYYFQLVGELGCAPGVLMLVEATTSLVERPLEQRAPQIHRNDQSSDHHPRAPPQYESAPPQAGIGALFPAPL
eukprot:GILI01029806.1.p1 GENE.GILI01029806.1~~GILI01029806.1.p1  ORF type:complete len:251 (-),score=19.38 GILI01029806.1:28-705(-)